MRIEDGLPHDFLVHLDHSMKETNICLTIFLTGQGYDENDREQVEKGLSSTAIKELDLDLAKLARWPLFVKILLFLHFYAISLPFIFWHS